jgi:hypothetical protein
MNPGTSPGEQRDSALALLEDLSECVGLDDRDPGQADLQETILTSGKAISPQDAARCVQDFVRTERFLRGAAEAIESALERFSERPVRVLYAGCGPFGMLALPIAHRWSPDEVRFTLLDCHARSLEAARQVAVELGVVDRIEGLVQADAAEYECPEHARPHVLVTETMQRALEKEPQVSITTNLARQLVAGGLVVPEKVELHFTLMNLEKEFAFDSQPLERERYEVGCVMTLDHRGGHCNNVTWPDIPLGELQPFLRTSIQVFADIQIGDYESGLTMPMPMDLATHQLQVGQQVHFEYLLHPQPRLVYSLD